MESTAQHRTITQEDKPDQQQRNPNEVYKPMGTHKTEEEMKKIVDDGEGHYDKDGFYILPDGSFYDPYGYYFSEDGYDQYGGYYDDDGYYVPGPEYEEEYFEMYQPESYIPETLEQEAERLAPFLEHVYPAIEWLRQQEADKKFVVQIQNIAHSILQHQVEKFLTNRIPDILQKGKLTYVKDEKNKKEGAAYITTTDKDLIEKLLKLHMTFHAGNYLRTYVMGFAYDYEKDSRDRYDNYKGEKMLAHEDEEEVDEDYGDEDHVEVPKTSNTQTTVVSQDEEFTLSKKTKKI